MAAYQRGDPCSACNLKPGTKCVNNQCIPCQIDTDINAAIGATSLTSTTPSGLDSESTLTTAPRPTTTTPRPTTTPRTTTPPRTRAAPFCRPYKATDCADEFAGCAEILEDSFCTNPLTSMWARKQCRNFCRFCGL